MSITDVFNRKVNAFFPNYFREASDYLYSSSYLDTFLDLDSSITLKDIKKFIKKHMDELVRSYSSDELFKNALLEKNNVVDRTKAPMINEDVIRKLLKDVINDNMNHSSMVMLLDVISFVRIYGLDDKRKIDSVLDNGIYHIIRNADIFYDDYIVPQTELMKMSDKLIVWSKVCGNDILNNVYNLDLLYQRVKGLFESSLEEVSIYKNELGGLLEDVKLAINVRDNGYVPSREEIKNINTIFKRYKAINVALINSSLDSEKFACIHFVQTDDVDYQLVNNSVIDVNQKDKSRENNFNSKQNDAFIRSYVSNLLEAFRRKYNMVFDTNNPEHRKFLQEQLRRFNYVLNNSPLERLPMVLRETGDHFKEFIRCSSTRLSCSFTSLDDISAHLDRKIGVLVRPKNDKGIISISLGYTSQKEYEDFRNDYISYLELVEQTKIHSVNETCLDTENCDVVGVIVLSDEKKVLEKATRLANNYQVPLIMQQTVSDQKKL